MELKSAQAPTNYEELKREIMLWPRVGMHKKEADGQKQTSFQKTGFVRMHEFNHIYPEIDEDIKRLVHEGYLVEFRDNNTLHKKIQEKNSTVNTKENERKATVLYPVNLDNPDTFNVEVRRD